MVRAHILIMFLILGGKFSVFQYLVCYLWTFHRFPLSGRGNSRFFLVSWIFLPWKVLDFCQIFFCVYWENHGGLFFIIILLIWCITLINFYMLQPCNPAVSSTWSCSIILLICYWIWFVNLLLRVFVSLFIRGIVLFSWDVFIWFWYLGNVAS